MIRMGTRWLAGLVFLVALAGVASAEMIGTFTTDSLSFISFGDAQVVPIPPGSTIKFRFAEPAADGSVAFTIHPADVSIQPVDLPNAQGQLQYALGSIASGSLTPMSDGRRMEFDATIRATLSGGSGGEGTFSYAMPFTTDSVEATSLDGAQTVSTYGMRVIDGVWFAQIVGATTNKHNAFPEPGAAVYTVLSGQFDTIPE